MHYKVKGRHSHFNMQTESSAVLQFLKGEIQALASY